MKTFFIWVEHQGLGVNVIDGLPAPRVRHRLRRVLTEEECDSLLGHCYTERDYAMLAVLMDTGMRVGELTNMQHENLLLDGVVVSGKSGERLIPLTAGVRSLVDEQGDPKYGVWLGRPGASRRRAVARRNRRIQTMLDKGRTEREVAANVGLHVRTIRKIKRAAS